MIFIDRSVPRPVATALQAVRSDVMWLEPYFSHRTPDADWLSVAGRNGWLVITRDNKIRTRPAERQALLDAGVGCFMITVRRNPTKWEMLRLIVCSLNEMEQLHAQDPMPFIYALNLSGLRRVA